MPIRRAVTIPALSLCGLLALIGFIALGNWQLERRLWKLALIERVESRVHAPAVPAPSLAHWPSVSQSTDEYRHVELHGQFLPDKDTLVVAATELGSGYWVLTPFQRLDGSIVIVNRGFIGQDVTPAPPPQAITTISGLLRLSEPKGSLLRDNSPSINRWYSRDVAAIAATLSLTAAPYFVDAKAHPNTDQTYSNNNNNSQIPVGGLTIIRFKNNHLVYAITWYALAISVLLAGIIGFRESRCYQD